MLATLSLPSAWVVLAALLALLVAAGVWEHRRVEAWVLHGPRGEAAMAAAVRVANRGRVVPALREPALDRRIAAVHRVPGRAPTQLVVTSRPGSASGTTTRSVERLDEVADPDGDLVVVVGAPGSGRTTLLVDLLESATDEPRRSAVWVDLSSYPGTLPFDLWLDRAIRANYGTPLPVVHHWFARGQLLVVMDNLERLGDETRSACIAGLRDIARDHPNTVLVLAMAEASFDEIAAVQAPTTVRVPPLTPRAVGEHLTELGTQWNGLRRLADEDPRVAQALGNRRMLATAVLACASDGYAELRAAVSRSGPEESVLDRYLDYAETRPMAAGSLEFDLVTSEGRRSYRASLRSVATVLATQDARHLYGWGPSVSWLPSRSRARRVRLAVVAVAAAAAAAIAYVLIGLFLPGTVAVGLGLAVAAVVLLRADHAVRRDAAASRGPTCRAGLSWSGPLWSGRVLLRALARTPVTSVLGALLLGSLGLLVDVTYIQVLATSRSGTYATLEVVVVVVLLVVAVLRRRGTLVDARYVNADRWTPPPERDPATTSRVLRGAAAVTLVGTALLAPLAGEISWIIAQPYDSFIGIYETGLVPVPFSLIVELELTAVAARGTAAHVLHTSGLWAAGLDAAVFGTLLGGALVIRLSPRVARAVARRHLVRRRQLPPDLERFLRFGAAIGILRGQGREYCFADEGVAAHLVGRREGPRATRRRHPLRTAVAVLAAVDVFLGIAVGLRSDETTAAAAAELATAQQPAMGPVVPVSLPPLPPGAHPYAPGVDPINAVGFIRRVKKTRQGADIALEMVDWRQCPGACADDHRVGITDARLHFFALTPATRCTLQQWLSPTGQVGTEPGDPSSLATEVANYPDSYYALDVAGNGAVVSLSEVYVP